MHSKSSKSSMCAPGEVGQSLDHLAEKANIADARVSLLNTSVLVTVFVITIFKVDFLIFVLLLLLIVLVFPFHPAIPAQIFISSKLCLMLLLLVLVQVDVSLLLCFVVCSEHVE